MNERKTKKRTQESTYDELLHQKLVVSLVSHGSFLLCTFNLALSGFTLFHDEGKMKVMKARFISLHFA